MKKDIYRFKTEVAKAYLAKLYFWAQDWENVIPLAEELLKDFPLLQGDDYVKMIQDKATTQSNVFIRSYVFQGADNSETQVSSAIPYRPVNKSFIDLFTEKEADIRYIPYTLENLPEVNPDALIRVDATGKPLTRLMAAIMNERQKELFMEGDRWFELKRNGRPEFWVAKDGQKYVCQKFMYTAPIHRNDLELVPGMQQNPGYE